MSSLRLLQQDFQNYILSGTDPIVGKVIGTEKVSAEVRLGIYSDAYRIRLLEVLATDYPGVKFLLDSEAAFREMGFAYIEAHPSPYFNIRWYGDRLAEFLKSAPPYSDRPILSEMAAFEWSTALAFDAADEAAAGIEDVSRIAPDAWGDMVCTPHPVVQRVDLRWNVPTIWKSVDAKSEPEAPYENDQPVPWVVWRRELKVYFRSLNVDEAWALDAMIAGTSFADICEGLCEWADETANETDVALHAAEMLKRWLADGLAQEIRIA